MSFIKREWDGRGTVGAMNAMYCSHEDVHVVKLGTVELKAVKPLLKRPNFQRYLISLFFPINLFCLVLLFFFFRSEE